MKIAEEQAKSGTDLGSEPLFLPTFLALLFQSLVGFESVQWNSAVDFYEGWVSFEIGDGAFVPWFHSENLKIDFFCDTKQYEK